MFRPDAQALLAIAHETLVRELLPQLAPEARYAGLMVANAMAIALRELAASPALADAARTLEVAAKALDEADADTAGWASAERRLARHIRRSQAGADPSADAAIHGALCLTAHARLAIDNPRALSDYFGLASQAS